MIDQAGLLAGAVTGAMALEMGGGDVVAQMNKALTAGYGTDVAQLEGGGALRVQSLDTVLQSTIQENKHFRLFNALPKPKAGATVDEWTEQDKVGGFLGGSTNSETGDIASFTGSYNRRVGLVKYLMCQRQVSLVQTYQKAIADSEAIEYSNGALQLLSDAEYLLFEGDDAVVPTEFSGLYAQMMDGVRSGQVDWQNIINMDGKALNSIHPLNLASAQVRRYGNFGTSTDIYFNQDVQADFDNSLDPAFRVALTNVGEGGLKLGAPVQAIRTSGGTIACNEDVFIRNDDMLQPFEVKYALVAYQQALLKPQAVVADASQNDVESKFTASRAGNYYYLVSGVNAAGASAGLVSAQVAVAQGKKVVLTITRSLAAQETGYIIYRSRQNGPNVVAGSVAGEGSDFREVARIGVQGATTTFTDNNRRIPGTTKAFVLNMLSSAHAISWKQLIPMIKFPLYANKAPILPWAQIMGGYLRLTKRKHHVVVDNILPSQQVWRPHPGE